jgi:hypothetical protein
MRQLGWQVEGRRCQATALMRLGLVGGEGDAGSMRRCRLAVAGVGVRRGGGGQVGDRSAVREKVGAGCQLARWSLPRLCTVAIRAHSLRAAASPRRRNRR